MLELTNYLYHKDTIKFIETEIYKMFECSLLKLVNYLLNKYFNLKILTNF